MIAESWGYPTPVTLRVVHTEPGPIPQSDVWGKRGGRVMETSLSVLTLEIYYRYLPIFKTQVIPSEEPQKKPAAGADNDPFG